MEDFSKTQRLIQQLLMDNTKIIENIGYRLLVIRHRHAGEIKTGKGSLEASKQKGLSPPFTKRADLEDSHSTETSNHLRSGRTEKDMASEQLKFTKLNSSKNTVSTSKIRSRLDQVRDKI